MKTSLQKRLPIEEYALLTKNAPELGAKLGQWYGFYQPATPGECELLDTAVMASVQRRRVLACLTETVNQEIRTARFDYDCAQEDEVDRYRAMLDSQPGVAVVGLKRSALGVRFLIGRWERLLKLITEEGTLYGNDRNEAINYQGALATKPEDLYHSEGAYLTWLYCLMCQPEPKDEKFVALGNEKWMPASLMESHDRHDHRAYNAFLKGRALSAKTGLLPGQPQVDLHEGADDTTATVAPMSGPEPRPVEQGAAKREQEAAALAPGGENGIGMPIPRGDNERAVVLATGPFSSEYLTVQKAVEIAAS